jgi:hypothetical protein
VRNAIGVGRWDGTWQLHRVSGLLPPLAGVRKRMHDARGETIVGPIRAPFEVRGDELHYRRPFTGFVDVLEPVDDRRANGRATFHGREFGRFELRRIGTADEGKSDRHDRRPEAR